VRACSADSRSSTWLRTNASAELATFCSFVVPTALLAQGKQKPLGTQIAT